MICLLFCRHYSLYIWLEDGFLEISENLTHKKTSPTAYHISHIVVDMNLKFL